MKTIIKYTIVGMSRGEENVEYIGAQLLNMRPKDYNEERLLASLSLIRGYDYILSDEELNFIFDYLRLKEKGSVRVIEHVQVGNLDPLGRQLSVNIQNGLGIFKEL